MCHVCEKRKTLGLKTLEAKRLGQQIEAVQMAFTVAAMSGDQAAMDKARAEYHELLDKLLTINAETTRLANEIAEDTINMIFGDDEDVSDHIAETASRNTLN